MDATQQTNSEQRFDNSFVLDLQDFILDRSTRCIDLCDIIDLFADQGTGYEV